MDEKLKADEVAGVSLVNTEVFLPIGDSQEFGKFLQQKCSQDGKPMDSAHCNHVIDTDIYEVHFPYDRPEEFAANAITGALYAQCDANCHEYILFDAIMDYHKDPSVSGAWHN